MKAYSRKWLQEVEWHAGELHYHILGILKDQSENLGNGDDKLSEAIYNAVFKKLQEGN